MARGDELFAKIEISFMHSEAFVSMSPGVFKLYMSLWCRALEIRRETFELPSSHYLATQAGLTSHPIATYLQLLVKCGLCQLNVSPTGSSITIVGVRAKHPKYLWKDSPNGERTGSEWGTKVPYTETETDTETDPPTPQGGSAEPPAVPAKRKSIPSRPKLSIEFKDGKFVGITDDLIAKWAKSYPALSIKTEISRAEDWLMANPKNQKSNYPRFLVNWFTRSQDRAGRVGGQNEKGNSKAWGFEERNYTDDPTLAAFQGRHTGAHKT